jgi:hypothetical protein
MLLALKTLRLSMPRGDREENPVLVTLGGGYERYSLSSSALHPKLYDRGVVMEQVRDGDQWGWYLIDPLDWDKPDDKACAEFNTLEQAREKAIGVSTRTNCTITKDRRVFDRLWNELPQRYRAPLTGQGQSGGYGVAVKIPGHTMPVLVETLWQRAHGVGNEAQTGY